MLIKQMETSWDGSQGNSMMKTSRTSNQTRSFSVDHLDLASGGHAIFFIFDHQKLVALDKF